MRLQYAAEQPASALLLFGSCWLGGRCFLGVTRKPLRAQLGGALAHCRFAILVFDPGLGAVLRLLRLALQLLLRGRAFRSQVLVIVFVHVKSPASHNIKGPRLVYQNEALIRPAGTSAVRGVLPAVL